MDETVKPLNKPRWTQEEIDAELAKRFYVPPPMDEQKIIPPNPIAWPLGKYDRQNRWKKRNPDKVRAYARQYMRERRAAMRGESFIIAKAR